MSPWDSYMLCSVGPKDADSILSLIDKLYDSGDFPLGGTWNLELLKGELQQGKGIGLRDKPSNELRAFILYRQWAKVFEISLLATKLSDHNKGLMKTLMTCLQKDLQRGDEIWLEVHAKNTAARGFYLMAGFDETGFRPGYYSDGSDAVLMTFLA